MDDGFRPGSISMRAEFETAKDPRSCTDHPLARMTGESLAILLQS